MKQETHTDNYLINLMTLLTSDNLKDVELGFLLLDNKNIKIKELSRDIYGLVRELEKYMGGCYNEFELIHYLFSNNDEVAYKFNKLGHEIFSNIAWSSSGDSFSTMDYTLKCNFFSNFLDTHKNVCLIHSL